MWRRIKSGEDGEDMQGLALPTKPTLEPISRPLYPEDGRQGGLTLDARHLMVVDLYEHFIVVFENILERDPVGRSVGRRGHHKPTSQQINKPSRRTYSINPGIVYRILSPR